MSLLRQTIAMEFPKVDCAEWSAKFGISVEFARIAHSMGVSEVALLEFFTRLNLVGLGQPITEFAVDNDEIKRRLHQTQMDAAANVVLDALRKIGEPNQRLAAVYECFGRDGRELLYLL